MGMGPTEPAALAAASLLAAGEVDEQGGQARTSAWPGQALLAGLVQQAVTDRDVAAVLDAATARPQDPAAVSALAQVLAVLAAENPAFRAELARLVGQAEHDPAIGQLATTIAGHARVGKVVTVGTAGTVNVHLPPPPPQTLLDRLHRAAVSGPLVANLPPRNPAFTGRAELLDQLHEHLHPGQAAAVVQVQAQALHGLGGVGKTQLALEYAHAHADDYDLIWWATAEQPAAIPGQLVALARRLGIPEAADQAETVQALWDELRGRDRWLLVFDNAEDPAELRRWWPPDSGRVLVTSRTPTWGGLAAAIPLDVLARAEAITFLRRRLGRDDAAFKRLAAALGDLPLALEQAAAYLEETDTAAADYVALLGVHARELFALGRPATTEQTVATTWTAALQRLRERAPAAEDLLTLCAFLAADDIPRSLPGQHPGVLPERLAAAAASPVLYQQNIGQLRRYALVKTTGDSFSVHRLVQAVVRHNLGPDDQRRWAATAVGLVLTAFPNQPDDVAGWPAAARLFPHALAATDLASAVDADPKSTGWLLNLAAAYLQRRGQFTESRPLLTRAVAILEEALGPSDPAVAAGLDNLGNALFALRELPAACQAHERALSIRRDVLGSDHLETARSLNDLGNALRGLGEFPAARAHYERALAIRRTKLGPDHPDTAMSLDNLGLSLHGLGDLPAARRAHQGALAVRRAQLGPDHPETARSLNNLGLVLHALGELSTARTSHERALAIRGEQLGPDNPHTASSMDNLGAVLRDLGDLEQARTLHERALAIRRAFLSPDHPHVARSLDNLAAVLHAQGDLNGAYSLQERALRIRKTRLGPDHPNTAQSLSSLASVLRDQGDLDAARPLLERALAIREARLGADHPLTVRSRRDLAALDEP
jgi:tetratricopeptide (TPR) repeat protein